MVTKIVSKGGLSLLATIINGTGLLFVADLNGPIFPDWDDWWDFREEITQTVQQQLIGCHMVIFCGDCIHSKEAYESFGIHTTFSWYRVPRNSICLGRELFFDPEQVRDAIRSIFAIEILPLLQSK